MGRFLLFMILCGSVFADAAFIWKNRRVPASESLSNAKQEACPLSFLCKKMRKAMLPVHFCDSKKSGCSRFTRRISPLLLHSLFDGLGHLGYKLVFSSIFYIKM